MRKFVTVSTLLTFKADNCLEINTGKNLAEIPKDANDRLFDEIIGHIEDLLLEDGFHAIQEEFLEKYWTIFEPTEENKLIYTEIFNEYNKTVETYIVNYLQKIIPHFNMNVFLHYLSEKQAELDGEVFEVLSAVTDFLAFKEMLLDYRAMKEGKVQDLSSGISITSVKNPITDFDLR
ncbi:ADP-ribosylation factor-like protein 2-binding protein isoform X2 [Vespa mandarinia]|uniref:ADP-ribosylation factor-like protein 2-binding protein isoform X2 n=1 Tax=Vespa mandarinia TaxID=7446 RepID=UPI00161B7BE6|nr:ADP-ribosylation factor-like protein 2-binding protein isoform X2 [Vespa mandarinia]XP_047361787.1 ADP-ribosylation factor-like protein 2-binding protein isoform X2 [Vespa velutina]